MLSSFYLRVPDTDAQWWADPFVFFWLQNFHYVATFIYVLMRQFFWMKWMFDFFIQPLGLYLLSQVYTYVWLYTSEDFRGVSVAFNSSKLYWSPIQSYCFVPRGGASCGLWDNLNPTRWFNSTHSLKFQNSMHFDLDIQYFDKCLMLYQYN